MTGPEHYREAEDLLARASQVTEWDAAHVARAQVHATLALAAAAALSSYLPGQDGMPMRESLAWLATCGEPRDTPCS